MGFAKYGVDLYINGHWHSYHRLLPINGNRNVTSITVGGAGCDEFSSDRLRSGLFDEKGENAGWGYRYYNREQTVAQMTVTATDLVFNTYASASGDLVDSLTLKK